MMATAPVKKDASLVNVIFCDWNGRMMPMQPDTIATIKKAAPISSPIAMDPAPESRALHDDLALLNSTQKKKTKKRENIPKGAKKIRASISQSQHSDTRL